MSAKEFYKKFTCDMEKVKSQAGDMVSGFSELFEKTMADGAISSKEKEFIALGIAVAKQCEPCIMVHTQKCLAAGATRQEIIEAASVAVVMEGGPAYAHIPLVISTLDELTPA